MEIVIPLLLLFAGIGGGLYAGNVGGGSLLTFPILVLVGLPTHIAIATQRLAATILDFTSAVRFNKEKKINFRIATPLCFIAMVGAFIGSHLVLEIPEKTLNAIIGIVFVLALILLIHKNHFGLTEKKYTRKRFLLTMILTFLLSVYSGFFGVGFGFFIILALVSSGFSFTGGAALGRAIGFCASLTGTLVFMNSGSIHYLYGISLGIGFAIGSWIGIGIGIKKGEKHIRKLLTAVVLISLIKLAFDFV